MKNKERGERNKERGERNNTMTHNYEQEEIIIRNNQEKKRGCREKSKFTANLLR